MDYNKRKNKEIMKELENSSLQLTKIQKFFPLYTEFFQLNQTNFQSIDFNHTWNIHHINTITDENHLTAIVKNNHLEKNVEVFCKYGTLLDPFKYMIGKYNISDTNLFLLPSLDNEVHPKMRTIHNASYVDTLFLYLSSTLLNNHQFIHGIDFYGNFLAIKHNLHLDIIDDFEYMNNYSFFKKNNNVLFTIPSFASETKPKITIGSNHSSLSIHDLDSIDILVNSSIVDSSDSIIEETILTSNNNSLSSSNCSSRTSYSSNEEEEEEEEYETVSEESSECFSEEHLEAIIHEFPVNIIFMEKCKDTMDNLFNLHLLSEDEWIASLFQVIMTLITYQKCFYFTHNDLHTNNIMFQPTELTHLSYIYNGITYKVPTYGKIFKIIDFGRAIFKIKNSLLCSDSFDKHGDATTQYNFGPFFNPSKTIIEPNFSFDLCRLACSIFDFIFDDISDIKNYHELSHFQQIIVDWCKDDKGHNVLYKSNGEERYEDFKLYRMIAKSVHNHLPHLQLDRPSFSQFKIQSDESLHSFNIDSLPIMFS